MELKLKSLLNFKHQGVLTRYEKEYPDSLMSAEETLAELMKYFWLCHKHAVDKKRFPRKRVLDFRCAMHTEMIEIDNMWHTFLLFTRDYHAFCRDYLGGIFFHHDPIPIDQPVLSEKKYEKELHRYLSYIEDNLGIDTLSKWFKVA